MEIFIYSSITETLAGVAWLSLIQVVFLVITLLFISFVNDFMLSSQKLTKYLFTQATKAFIGSPHSCSITSAIFVQTFAQTNSLLLSLLTKVPSRILSLLLSIKNNK